MTKVAKKILHVQMLLQSSCHTLILHFTEYPDYHRAKIQSKIFWPGWSGGQDSGTTQFSFNFELELSLAILKI